MADVKINGVNAPTVSDMDVAVGYLRGKGMAIMREEGDGSSVARSLMRSANLLDHIAQSADTHPERLRRR